MTDMFDRFDICNAYFMYSILWGHDSYTNGIQSRLRRIGYRPARSEEYLEGMSENAKAIYGALVRRHQGDFVAYERLYRRQPEVFGPWPGTNNCGSVRSFLRARGLERAIEAWS
jgi:hypothetical protein